VVGYDSFVSSPDGTEVTITFDFTTHIERVTVDSSHPGNIKKVKVEKKA